MEELKDRQTLFYGTLLATAGGPNIHVQPLACLNKIPQGNKIERNVYFMVVFQ